MGDNDFGDVLRWVAEADGTLNLEECELGGASDANMKRLCGALATKTAAITKLAVGGNRLLSLDLLRETVQLRQNQGSSSESKSSSERTRDGEEAEEEKKEEDRMGDSDWALGRLEVLSARSNGLVSLWGGGPNRMAALAGSLVELDLTNNALGTGNNGRLPQELWELVQLRVLRIAENELSSLGVSGERGLGRLTRLEVLDCRLNSLASLPAEDLEELRALRKLLIANNPLGQLPTEICALQMLEKLDCTTCRLLALPDALGQLSRLRRLVCNDNQLTELPMGLVDLAVLENLECGFNDLQRSRTLPALLRSPTCALQRLGLEDNNFSEENIDVLAEALKENESVRELRLEYNTLEDKCYSALTEALMVNSYIQTLNLGLDLDGMPRTCIDECLTQNKVAPANAAQRARCLVWCCERLRQKLLADDAEEEKDNDGNNDTATSAAGDDALRFGSSLGCIPPHVMPPAAEHAASLVIGVRNTMGIKEAFLVQQMENIRAEAAREQEIMQREMDELRAQLKRAHATNNNDGGGDTEEQEPAGKRAKTE